MINKNNVEQLWALYEDYREEFYKNYYSDVKCDDFETYVANNITKCSNCGDYVHIDEMGVSELALEEHICAYCMRNGYGK